MDRSFYSFVTIHACDRQTDGRTDGRTEFSSLDRVCISCSAVKIGQILLLSLSQFTRLTDRRTDRRTDSFLIARQRLHSCSAVKANCFHASNEAPLFWERSESSAYLIHPSVYAVLVSYGLL